ncbi:MAG: hypothetical protein ACFFB2_07895 [Promethearchaeota archaeon]
MAQLKFQLIYTFHIEKAIFLFIIHVLLISHIFPVIQSSPLDATTIEESLTSHNIEVNEQILHYYLYHPPQEPVGAVLIIPHLTGDHETYLIGDFWEQPEENMLDSPLIQTAREFGLALVFAEGAVGDYYAPNNGEKKVLACMEDANTTFLQLNCNKWFIYGFSMGGMGAVTIFVRHPNLFNGLFSGGGIPDFREEIFLIHYRRTWPSDEMIFTASPHHHLEVFYNKSLFLATGKGDYIYHTYDNFSQLLDMHGIKHYYHRGNEGHTYRLLFNTMNSTFKMFSQDIQGTLDIFFEGYISPLYPRTMTPGTSYSLVESSIVSSSKRSIISKTINWNISIIYAILSFSAIIYFVKCSKLK